MIGKLCAIENKMADIQNNHAGNYAAMEKCMEDMDINMSIISSCPFSAQLSVEVVDQMKVNQSSTPIFAIA